MTRRGTRIILILIAFLFFDTARSAEHDDVVKRSVEQTDRNRISVSREKSCGSGCC